MLALTMLFQALLAPRQRATIVLRRTPPLSRTTSRWVYTGHETALTKTTSLAVALWRSLRRRGMRELLRSGVRRGEG